MSRSLAMEIISALASASRTRRHPGNDGPDIERDFEVGEFERLEIAAPFDVDIETGPVVNVHASGPEWALDLVRVEVQDGRLFIACDGDCDGSDVSMSVSLPKLRGLKMAGSGDVSVNEVTGDAFDCKCSGSGDLSVES
ncbi:MAG: GIN domain-containing protein, partial [Sphingomicrobium sp.]